MKTITIGVVAMVTVFAVSAVVGAQGPGTVRSAGTDLLAGLVGDMVRFERGMSTLDEILSKNPNDMEAKVLHGNGVMARAGEAFKVGDNAKAIQLWQSGLDEMAQAVQAAPENVFVRARRGVFMISASRSTPPQMAKSLLETAVADFGKVLEIREKEPTLGERSVHQRGELLNVIPQPGARPNHQRVAAVDHRAQRVQSPAGAHQEADSQITQQHGDQRHRV